jgi:hypothetical protein
VDSCLAVADNRGLVSLMTLGEVVSWSHEADGSGNFVSCLLSAYLTLCNVVGT